MGLGEWGAALLLGIVVARLVMMTIRPLVGEDLSSRPGGRMSARVFHKLLSRAERHELESAFARVLAEHEPVAQPRVLALAASLGRKQVRVGGIVRHGNGVMLRCQDGTDLILLRVPLSAGVLEQLHWRSKRGDLVLREICVVSNAVELALQSSAGTTRVRASKVLLG